MGITVPTTGANHSSAVLVAKKATITQMMPIQGFRELATGPYNFLKR